MNQNESKGKMNQNESKGKMDQNELKELDKLINDRTLKLVGDQVYFFSSCIVSYFHKFYISSININSFCIIYFASFGIWFC